MTSKLVPQTPATEPGGRFPDRPPRDDMQNSIYLSRPAHQAALSRHLGSPDTTLVLSEIPVSRHPSQGNDLRIPDLLVAFDIDPAAAIAQRGYAIEHQGKPPDFVLEIASETTGRNDYTAKRDDYAAFGIPEYWRFDPTGGQYHDAPLAGDALKDGVYRPITIVQTSETHYWGYSAVLNLDLCWEAGQLRWWDPEAQRYLLTFDETDEQRIVERTGRLAAEARIRLLEEELRRSQGP